VEGFNPERIRSLKAGIEATLGGKIRSAAIFDRDYISDTECTSIAKDCAQICDRVVVHERKEIENFLLVPSAIDRAASRRLLDVSRRTGSATKYDFDSASTLQGFAQEKKAYVISQYLGVQRAYERRNAPGISEATSAEAVLNGFEGLWSEEERRLEVIPGKDALSALNQGLQARHKISVTPTAIIDAMKLEEVPTEMKNLIRTISEFCHLALDG
jgi:hypothetical protein